MAIASEGRHVSDAAATHWAISDTPVAYETAINIMSDRIRAIRDEGAPELVWLLEHPPLYTAGTSARDHDLIDVDMFPVYRTGRGGQFTYHGPGQRVAYVMLDLRQRGFDIRAFVHRLESWIVGALAEFNVRGHVRPDRVGVWVNHPSENGTVEDKIAALGLRVSRSVSSHGISLNVDPDLGHYRGIIPCGIGDAGVTSLAQLGLPVTMHDVDVALKKSFVATFGPVHHVR
jgi:lipoyl(octanoyl) transferase